MSISVVSLVLYGTVAAVGFGLNVAVLLAFVKGKLFRPPHSSIYILAFQSLVVDVLFISLHLFFWIPKAIYPEFLSLDGYDFIILRLFDAIGTYAWFHNALSHFVIAANRVVVIVFYERDLLSRPRVIIMAVLHHLLAATITLLTQFAIPCCRLSFNFSIFSYFNVPNGDMANYSDMIFTIPVNSISTCASFVGYAAILYTVRKARLTSAKSGAKISQQRKSEYSYALQFASLALVFSFCWISFRVFPLIIPLSDPSLSWVFGLTTVFTMVNCFMNALVYLLNNKEVQQNLPSFGYPSYVCHLTVATRSSR